MQSLTLLERSSSENSSAGDDTYFEDRVVNVICRRSVVSTSGRQDAVEVQNTGKPSPVYLPRKRSGMAKRVEETETKLM